MRSTNIIPPPKLIFNLTNLYTLPSSNDPEGLYYTTIIKSGPSFASLVSSNTKLSLYPSNCATDFVDFTVVIELTDE